MQEQLNEHAAIAQAIWRSPQLVRASERTIPDKTFKVTLRSAKVLLRVHLQIARSASISPRIAPSRARRQFGEVILNFSKIRI